QARASSGSLFGAGALARANLCSDCCYRLEALAGYRYLHFSDQVDIIEKLTSTDPAQTFAPLGTSIVVADRFRTTNQFHGGDVGLSGEICWDAWTLVGTARIALGCTQ